ncbi:ATP-binding protein [Bacillus salitolerans]|uniref:histidine kinase n=1 Tax=Bacillus salitolerans TaxID=1437434 RepID=A0ABW4LPB8_9BACI
MTIIEETFSIQASIFTIIVSFLTVFITLHLVSRISVLTHRINRFFLKVLAAFSTSLGLFAVHYITMLGYYESIFLDYRILMICASFIIPFIFAIITIFILNKISRRYRLVASAIAFFMTINSIYGLGVWALDGQYSFTINYIAILPATFIFLALFVLGLMMTFAKNGSVNRPSLFILGSLLISTLVFVYHYVLLKSTTLFYDSTIPTSSVINTDKTLIITLVGVSTVFIHIIILMTTYYERYSTENEKQRLNEQNTLLVNNSPMIMIKFDSDGLILDVNEACALKLGYFKSELIQSSILSLLANRPINTAEFIHQLVKMDQEDQLSEFNMLTKAGEIIEVLLTIMPIQLKNQLQGYIVMAKDISEQKRLQRVKEESEQELKHLIHSQVGILFKMKKEKEDFVLTFIDGQLMKKIDLVSTHIVGTKFSDFPLHEDEYKRNLLHFNKAWNGEYVTYENSYLKYELLLSLVPIKNENGHVVEVIGSVVDISKQKQVEQELLTAKREADQANHAKSDFISKMSHELRTPLNGVLGFAQVLEMDGSLSEEQHDHVREIMRAGRHLLQLINTIVDLNRIESGKLKFSLSEIEIGSVISEVTGLFGPLTKKKNIQIIQEIKEELVMIGDPTKLRQVFINLIDNAIKYTPNGGIVYVDVSNEQERLTVSIRDTGVGIPASDVEKVFDPFFRSSFNREYANGAGIGLTLVKQIVESMDGEIALNSFENHGTIVCLSFPLIKHVT